MLADYHLHTEFSDDSEYPMEQEVLDAIAIGLKEICFTDHVDYGIKCDFDEDHEPYIKRYGKDNYRVNTNYPVYFQRIAEMQRKYKDQISIKKGLEFGVQLKEIPRYEKLYEKYPMDFIILSVHEIDDEWLFYWLRQKGNQKEYNLEYYRSLYECVKNFKHYSVLGHVDQIKRYDPLGSIAFNEIEDAVAEVLKVAIADGKGIEINTSSYFKGATEPMPSFDIVKLYHDLGGKIVTVGSDTHFPGTLTLNFDEVFARLKAIGFDEYCTFDKMEPIFHKIK